MTTDFKKDSEAISGVYWKYLVKNYDHRGYLAEIFRIDEIPINHASMAYVSVTNPGVTRGPHEHVSQTDIFCFLSGTFHVWLWDARPKSKTNGHRMILPTSCDSFDGVFTTVVVPPGVVHAYKNMSRDAGMVINMPDRLYKVCLGSE